MNEKNILTIAVFSHFLSQRKFSTVCVCCRFCPNISSSPPETFSALHVIYMCVYKRYSCNMPMPNRNSVKLMQTWLCVSVRSLMHMISNHFNWSALIRWIVSGLFMCVCVGVRQQCPSICYIYVYYTVKLRGQVKLHEASIMNPRMSINSEKYFHNIGCLCVCNLVYSS